MRQPDQKIQSAIKSLSTSSNFDVLIEWLRLCMNFSLKESCKREKDVESRWLQGEARAFNFILDEVEKAKQNIL